MNQTSATGNAAGPIGDTVSLLTTVHLAWIGVLVVLVVIGILYGAKVKRQRLAAERRAAEHARQAGVTPVPSSDAPPLAAGEAEPAPTDTTPAPRAAIVPPAPAVAGGDASNGTVGQLKGLGPKVQARLAELGITTVGQIAALDHDAAQALDAQLGAFRGRIERDRWVEQARFLAAGDRAGFEAVFGRL